MGATVFIPHGNWIGVENNSSEPAMILFFVNKPAFEQCLRAMSSRRGENFTMPVPENMAKVRAECHEVTKDRNTATWDTSPNVGDQWLHCLNRGTR
jgi:hypothetical protein